MAGQRRLSPRAIARREPERIPRSREESKPDPRPRRTRPRVSTPPPFRPPSRKRYRRREGVMRAAIPSQSATPARSPEWPLQERRHSRARAGAARSSERRRRERTSSRVGRQARGKVLSPSPSAASLGDSSSRTAPRREVHTQAHSQGRRARGTAHRGAGKSRPGDHAITPSQAPDPGRGKQPALPLASPPRSARPALRGDLSPAGLRLPWRTASARWRGLSPLRADASRKGLLQAGTRVRGEGLSPHPQRGMTGRTTL